MGLPIRTGLDRLLREKDAVGRRRWGLLAHGASVTEDLRPAHLALAATFGPPAALFGPEHGFYPVEQDMVASEDMADPWTGASIRSLYGDSEDTLVPSPDAFDGLDLLIIDLQD
ncbi:MAG: exo-beta-N-acetylmuramidase NamZ domain-containing protein, partial [Acidobacteriota bacterium]